MYLVLSAFTSSPVTLLANTKASVFFFIVRRLPPNILPSSADVYHLISSRILDKIFYVVDKIGMPCNNYNLFYHPAYK